MSIRSIRDEVELLQAHEEHAKSLVNLWNDGLIDLDIGDDRPVRTIGGALDQLCKILDRCIRARNQQVEQDDDPRLEYGYDPGR